MAYAKTLIAVVATILTAVGPLLLNDRLSPQGWVSVLIAALGALSVYGAANLPAGVWHYAKGILALGSAAAVTAADLIVDGRLGGADWLQVGAAGLGALLVIAVPNTGVPDYVPTLAAAPAHLLVDSGEHGDEQLSTTTPLPVVGDAFRLRVEHLVLPPSTPAGMDLGVIGGLCRRMRTTTLDWDPVPVVELPDAPGYYMIGDGRARFLAAVISGRPDLLCRDDG